MTTKVAIVTHPKRAAECVYLIRDLFRQGFAREDIKVCCDYQGLGCKGNHLRAWEWLGNQAKNNSQQGVAAQYGLVLEDDVLLCEDFKANLQRALDHAPTPVLSLYLGRGRPPQYQERIALAITQQISFILGDAFLGTQGYCMPLAYFGEKIQEQVSASQLPIDDSITAWLRSWHGRVSFPKYSLIDHRDGPTLIADHGDGQPRNGTTALCVEDCDPSGAKLPEVRKAWLMAGHNTVWDLGSVPLPEGEIYEADIP